MAAADEVALLERLISYDTSRDEGIQEAFAFLKGWLEARSISHASTSRTGCRRSSPPSATGPRTIVWNAHVDVVPGRAEQFSPWRVNGRVYGRGAYDMKGGLAGMLAALADLADARDTIPGVKVKLLIVPDEEREDEPAGGKASAFLAEEGHVGEFVICGEPTDLEIGVQSKGVLVLRIDVEGRAAHGSTPWLGENAILRAIDLYQRILELPFSTGQSELFARPSINIGRISGGDVVNKVPDHCRIDVDIRYLPNQDPDEMLRQVRGARRDDRSRRSTSCRRRRSIRARSMSACCARRCATSGGGEAPAVGRDGASDAVFFLAAASPASSSAPPAAATTGPRSTSRSSRWPATGSALVAFAQRLATAENG